MNTKQRILSIKLEEKIIKNPNYAKQLGLKIINKKLPIKKEKV